MKRTVYKTVKNMQILVHNLLKDIRTARELEEKTDKQTLLENYKKDRQSAGELQYKKRQTDNKKTERNGYMDGRTNKRIML
jgi:hypothetical protein